MSTKEIEQAAIERRIQIVEYLKCQDGTNTSSQIAAALSINRGTLGHDLDLLRRQGKIILTKNNNSNCYFWSANV